jgi:hypothetical protein
VSPGNLRQMQLNHWVFTPECCLLSLTVCSVFRAGHQTVLRPWFQFWGWREQGGMSVKWGNGPVRAGAGDGVRTLVGLPLRYTVSSGVTARTARGAKAVQLPTRETGY